jgi:hypothetical protein
MKIFAAIAFGGLVLVTMSSGASAWECYAVGKGGSGRAESDSRERARSRALYQCSRRGRQCRIESCVPTHGSD